MKHGHNLLRFERFGGTFAWRRKERRRNIKSIIAGKRRFTSVISFGESLYVVIAISAERIYGSRGRNAVRRFIKEKHNEYVTLYECVNRMYSSLNLNVLSHPRAETMKRLIKKYILLPRDLIHVATAIENGCDYLLTLDDDFKQIDEGIEIIVID